MMETRVAGFPTKLVPLPYWRAILVEARGRQQGPLVEGTLRFVKLCQISAPPRH